MDQLASIGVEFDEATITRIFTRLQSDYYQLASAQEKAKRPPPPTTSEDPIAGDDEPGASSAGCCGAFGKILPSVREWAMSPIYTDNAPVRPWGLGAILGSEGGFYKLAGLSVRTPGMYKKVDPQTGRATSVYLEDTNERIHSSVRVRLALQGLGLNDHGLWKAPALKGHWRLKKTTEPIVDPIPASVQTWEPYSAANVDKNIQEAITQQRPLSAAANRGYRWVWEYHGPLKHEPPWPVMVEEPLGPYERQLLRLSGGVPNVYEFAESINVTLP